METVAASRLRARTAEPRRTLIAETSIPRLRIGATRTNARIRTTTAASARTTGRPKTIASHPATRSDRDYRTYGLTGLAPVTLPFPFQRWRAATPPRGA